MRALLQKPLFLSALAVTTGLTAAELRILTDTNEPVEFGTAIIAETKFKTNFENGRLILPNLKPGTYSLRVTAPNYVSLEERLQLPLKKPVALVMQLQTRRTQKVRLITYEEKHNVSKHQLQPHELKSVTATSSADQTCGIFVANNAAR